MTEYLTIKQLSKLYQCDRRSIVFECVRGNWGAKRISQGVRVPGWRVFNPPTTDPVMLPKDLARIMDVSHQLVIRWCDEGKIKSFRVGRSYRIFYNDGARLILMRQCGMVKGLL